MSPKVTFFEFTSYKFEPSKRKVVFNYNTQFNDKKALHFTETIILPKIPDMNHVPKELIKKLLESLHIILGISYYKLYCPKKIKIKYALSKREIEFWNIVYKRGLGEFFYKNKLNPNISPQFPFIKETRRSDRGPTSATSIPYTLHPKSLVGIGGGKDSVVVSELLKANNFDFSTFFVETNKKSDVVNKIAGLIGKDRLIIRRILDPKVFEQHQYSGHIPISAIYAFLGVFTAVLYSYYYVIVSNEYSSNFGNLKYKGININHQWSKSFEFEKLFQEYVYNFITPNVTYFSLLRRFYEIRIVEMFSKMSKYFPYFSSCNLNFKINRGNLGRKLWCCQCAKCVFVFTMLSAFLPKRELLKIFRKNLYQDKSLLPLFKDILGLGRMKPFDCVGTFEEARVAFCIGTKKIVLNDILRRLRNKCCKMSIMRHLGKRARYYPEFFKASGEYAIPEQFKFLGTESALILGYGKEGKATEKYLKKFYPKIRIGIADEKQGREYMKNIDRFDIVIKTPGIKKELIKIPYTTATNMFFSKTKDRNLIIGVTGSKGKSTTSSLIFEILKKAGKKAELLGNIGKPMLERVLKSVNKKTIFVLELSSYQLDDIKFSPDIAVVTNLFPEHMDYHGSLKNYYDAKKNIINFQDKDNYFIYDPKNKIMNRWLRNYCGKPIQFSKNIFESKLIGEHNKNNIRAAIAVVKILNIQDKTIKDAIKNFKPLPHRLEFVGGFKRIKFYDDGSSTNPESAILAIEALKKVDTILLGGEDRGYDFSQLERAIKKYKIRNIVLFPDSGKKIIKNKKDFNIFYTSKMKDAVKFAYQNTKKGSVCLLSGASPSYSLWENFEEKGDQFKYYVKKLSK